MFDFFKTKTAFIEEVKSIPLFIYDYLFTYSSYLKNDALGKLKKSIDVDSGKFIEFKYEIFAFLIIALGSMMKQLNSPKMSEKLRSLFYESAIENCAANILDTNSKKVHKVMFIKILSKWQNKIDAIEAMKGGYQLNDLYEILDERYTLVANKKSEFDLKELGREVLGNVLEKLAEKFPIFAQEIFKSS